MSTKPQIELFLENENGSQQVTYPFVEADHVSLSNGMDIDTMIRQDVSMPTVTHEDLSFKVGVGDQNVSSAIVDNSVAEMTIKGQTYQNILPEPSTHVLSSNKEMFKVNEGLDPIVEVVDGVSKSAILSGCTLVNGLSNPKKNQGKGYVTIVSPTHLIINHGENIAGEKASVIYEWFGGKMEDGVDYTLDIWILKNTMHRKTDPNASIGKINFNNYNSGFYSIPSNTLGHITYEVTTSKTNTGGKPYIETFNTCEGELEIQMVVRQGRNLEPIEKHFEGMTSCKMPVLCTIGKNLFNSNNTIDGYGFSVGEVIVKDTWFISDYIEVKPNLSYIISASDNSVAGRRVNFYDKDKNFVETGRYENLIITVPNNNKIFYMRTNADLSIKSSYQIEQGTVATSYESYKSNILHTTNLLSNTTLTQGCINTDGSLTTSGESASYSVFTEIIPVKPNTEYYIATDNADITYDRIAYYNSSKTFMRRSDTLYASKSTSLTIPNDTYYIRIAFYQGSGIQITPQQLGNAVCQEMVVLRSLPNGIKDTLNLNTGEYVQRIGEITFKNQTAWEVAGGYPNLYYYNTNDIGNANIYVGSGAIPNLYCDKMAVTSYSGLQQSTSGVKISNRGKEGTHSIAVYNSDITSNVVDFKAWLTQNPFTVQYELATPVVKTVDLSSSGNWEKVVYNGMESWNKHDTWSSGELLAMHTSCRGKLVGGLAFSDKFDGMKFSEASSNSVATKECIRYDAGSATIYVFIKKSRLQESSIDGFKQWLKDNGLTVWYQTETHLDSTQVKQPIFFKDGHIIQTSGTDNSLIPTLDYQAKTSNSYVMDLMKANTIYTMKNDLANGKFTIDGTQYNLVTNGKLKTPTTLTDKLLVINGSASNTMILEGDLTSKTIPYFKGIKSTFEDESKIEVLSVGKNVFDYSEHPITLEKLAYNNGVLAVWTGYIGVKTYVPVKENTTYTYSNDINIGIYYGLVFYDKNKNVISYVNSGENNAWIPSTFTTPKNCAYIRFSMQTQTIPTWIQIEESSIQTTHEPYKSNNTKIPLLSPLRSLPNGVCDEIILDRENNKAKVIRRVGKIAVVAPQVSKWYIDNNGVVNVSRIRLEINSLGAKKGQKQLINNLVPVTGRGFSFDEETTYMDDAQNYWLWLHVSNSRLPAPTIEGFKSWLSQNPLVTYYELETPIITEVDLEGFPYVYKDGHIFLNGEIAPVTEIKYSINQQHQIEASNQDIIRHQKEIDYLYKLIGEYVRVDYKNTLLSLNLELK